VKGALFVLTVLAACSAPERQSPLALKGLLRALLDRVPASLTACAPNHRTYDRPFWRAPYRDCTDSVAGGWQNFELDADSVVMDLARTWTVPPFEQRARWDREANRLTRLFGLPVRSNNRPPDSSLSASPLLRSYCVAWHGPDSVEVTLYLEPDTDVGPPREDAPWQLRRYARHGPLLGARSCGLRS
jgi:hypothetical protein